MTITTTTTTPVSIPVTTYSVPAPDTTLISAVVQSDLVTITYGGTSMVVPVEAMEALTSLMAMVSSENGPAIVTTV